MPQSVRYHWLRDAEKAPVACIASKRDPEGVFVTFAVSTYNPNDKFNRKQGRELADQRLSEGEGTGTVSTARNVKMGILATIVRTEELKLRVRKAAHYQIGQLLHR